MLTVRIVSPVGIRKCHVCGEKLPKGMKHVRVVADFNHDYLNLCFQCINMARVGANIDRLSHRF